MSEKGFVQSNLGWILASGVVVLAAVGAFDPIKERLLEARTDAGAPATQTPAPVSDAAVGAAALATVMQQVPAARSAGTGGVDVTRGAMQAAPLLDASQMEETTIAAALDASMQAGLLGGAPTGAAQPEPVAAPAPVTAPTPAPSTGNLNLFQAAAPGAAGTDTCLQDLRAMAAASRVYFPSGGTTPNESGLAQARIVAHLAEACPGVRIEVHGHSDASGSSAANLVLSQQRAEAVVARLSAMGANTALFIPVGMGDSVPSGVTGSQDPAFYDRRVDFAVITDGSGSSSGGGQSRPVARAELANLPCVGDLRAAVQDQVLIYPPRSIVLSSEQLSQALVLAEAAVACPGARLRVVGQFSDDAGSGEAPETGRLRASVLMTMLTNAGVPSEQIIMAAPSEPTVKASAPGLPETRVDFDVVLEEG